MPSFISPTANSSMKLIGFGIWGDAMATATPSRSRLGSTQSTVERRSFALLRPIADTSAQERVRDFVLQAYAEHEAREAIESTT